MRPALSFFFLEHLQDFTCLASTDRGHKFFEPVALWCTRPYAVVRSYSSVGAGRWAVGLHGLRRDGFFKIVSPIRLVSFPGRAAAQRTVRAQLRD